jgi:hypothetical protein
MYRILRMSCGREFRSALFTSSRYDWSQYRDVYTRRLIIRFLSISFLLVYLYVSLCRAALDGDTFLAFWLVSYEFIA